jgi:hypothetical protein
MEQTYDACESSVLCARCSMPADAKYFDESAVAAAPLPGRSVVLVHFELPPQYCGVLEYFSQYTDQYGRSCENIETSGLTWTLRVNQRPLYPYIDLKHIVNPWGYGSFQVALRLDESARLDLVVTGTQGSRATNIASNIIGSPLEQTVTPASMEGITAGTVLRAAASSSQEEEVKATAVSPDGLSFNAVFRNSHTAPVALSKRTIKHVGARIMGRYWYNPAFGDVRR